MKKLAWIFLTLLVIALTTSCGERAPKYLTNGPNYLKGLKEVKRGELGKAEVSFLKDLSFKKSYASHLQLTFIYEEQLKYPDVLVQCDQYLKKASTTDFNLNLVKEIKKEALESLHMQLNSQFGAVAKKTVNLNHKAETFFREKWYAARVRERDLKVKLQNLESEAKLEKLLGKSEMRQPSKIPKKSTNSKPTKKRITTYLVVKGDSLSVISTKVFGTSKRWREIQAANLPALDNPNKLRVGQTIKIPQPIQKKKRITTINKKAKPQAKIAPLQKKKKLKRDKRKSKFILIQTSKPLGSHNKIVPRSRK